MNSIVSTKTRIGIIGNGIAGSAIARLLKSQEFENVEIHELSSKEELNSSQGILTTKGATAALLHPPALRSLRFSGDNEIISSFDPNSKSSHDNLSQSNFLTYAGIRSLKGEVLRDYLPSSASKSSRAFGGGLFGLAPPKPNFEPHMPSLIISPYSFVEMMNSGLSPSSLHFNSKLLSLQYAPSSLHHHDRSQSPSKSDSSSFSSTATPHALSLFAEFSGGNIREYDLLIAADGVSSPSSALFSHSTQNLSQQDPKFSEKLLLHVIPQSHLDFSPEPAIAFEGIVPRSILNALPGSSSVLDLLRTLTQEQRHHQGKVSASDSTGIFYDFVADKRRVFITELPTGDLVFKIQVPLLAFVSGARKGRTPIKVFSSSLFAPILDLASLPVEEREKIFQGQTPEKPFARVSSSDAEVISLLSSFIPLIGNSSDEFVTGVSAVQDCFSESSSGWVSSILSLLSQVPQVTPTHLRDEPVRCNFRVVFGAHHAALVAWLDSSSSSSLESSPHAGMVCVGASANTFLNEFDLSASMAIEGVGVLAAALTRARDSELSLGSALGEYTRERKTRVNAMRKIVSTEAVQTSNQSGFAKQLLPMMNNFFKFANAENVQREYEQIYAYDPIFNLMNPHK